MNRNLLGVQFSGIVQVRDRLLQLDNPLRLESGEPSFDMPEHIKMAFIKSLVDNQTHYAPSTGILPLREAVVEKVQKENNIKNITEPSQVNITNGGMHALYCAFRTILEPGDEVIVPRPNWTATSQIIRLCGGIPVYLDLAIGKDTLWDSWELSQVISEYTKAILINSPHNPTGTVIGDEELGMILETAIENDLYLISDEAYEDIHYSSYPMSVGSLSSYDKVISCFSFSKSYAMTGERLGYMVCANKHFNDNVKKMILFTINGVSTPTQYAGLAALKGPQRCVYDMRDEYERRRNMLFDGLQNVEYLDCTYNPEGAFYMYAYINDKWEGTAWDMVNYLIDEYQMGSVPGDIFYDERPAIRFSYACSTDEIQRAVEVLQK